MPLPSYNLNYFPQVALFYSLQKGDLLPHALDLARSILKVETPSHPDIHIYEPDPISHLHPIESIAALLQALQKTPYSATHSIFILNHAEKMLPPSANALLKTLEEPPESAYLFLLSLSHKKLLSTILSRVKKFPLSSTPSVEESHHQSFFTTLFGLKTIPEKIVFLETLKEPSEKKEEFIHRFLEELLFWIKNHAPNQFPFWKKEAVEIKQATFYHIKLRTALENSLIQEHLSRSITHPTSHT